MSQKEEQVLKDLVIQSLATKGFLGKIQAEIRAGVFVALEEQDVLKDIFINKPLKDFIETSNGALVISLVREFLEFFNLSFTNMVFGPETHAGIDYSFQGRKKLANDLNLSCDEDDKVPLLGLLLQSFNSSKNINNISSSFVNGHSDGNMKLNETKANESTILEPSESIQNQSMPNDSTFLITNVSTENAEETIHRYDKNIEDSPNANKSPSLYGLPPLSNQKTDVGDCTSSKVDMKQLNELLQFEPDGGDANYEEDFVSSGSDKKDKTDSTESEIEEELPSNSNHSNGDDLTGDMTISKESGQGDYTEKLSSS